MIYLKHSSQKQNSQIRLIKQLFFVFHINYDDNNIFFDKEKNIDLKKKKH